MDVSVVIPSYNASKTIGRCLDSVLHQKAKASYEIIVVDSSRDSTASIIKQSSGIKLIHSSKRLFAGEARNRGIKSAKGRIIAFTDADCVADSGWIDSIFSLHKHHDAVGGRVLNGNPDSLLGWSIFLSQFSEFSVPKDRFVKNMPTCNVSYKKNLFDDGLFPDVFSHEEFLFNARLPVPIFFSKKVVARHINRTNFFDILKHEYKNGQGAAFSRKKAGKLSFVFALKFPILFLGLWRFVKCGYCSARGGNALIFLLASPLILLNLLSWNLGFLAWTMKRN
jgi:glycosyltransferase involved in cell wall biosynthesis